MADFADMVVAVGTRAEILIDTWWDCKCAGDHEEENRDCDSSVVAGYEVTIGLSSDQESRGRVALEDVKDSEPRRALREALGDALDLFEAATS